MKVAINEAKTQLTKLIAAVEAGEAVTITRHGTPVVDLVPHQSPFDPEEHRKALAELKGCVPHDGISAAEFDDFLYDENGFPA